MFNKLICSYLNFLQMDSPYFYHFWKSPWRFPGCLYDTTSVIEIPIIQGFVPDDSQPPHYCWVNLMVPSSQESSSTLKGSSFDVAFQQWWNNSCWIEVYIPSIHLFPSRVIFSAKWDSPVRLDKYRLVEFFLNVFQNSLRLILQWMMPCCAILFCCTRQFILP